jgi:hypothetical protein
MAASDLFILLGEDEEGLHINRYIGAFSSLEIAQAAVPGSTWTFTPDDPEPAWEGKRGYAEFLIVADRIDDGADR